jgi:DNA-binding transcriptional LysR family regulator
MPSFDELAAFLAVLETGSFTTASRRLRLTTNGVSLRVRRLESRLGRRLFLRSTRVVRPTAEALRFAERVSPILEALEQAEGELVENSARLRGRVRIGLAGALATREFLARLRALLVEHPELTVELRVSGQDLDLRREGLDIAVVVGLSSTSTLIGRKLGRIEWVLAASPEYLERRERPRRPEDLRAHECLRFAQHPPQDEWTLIDARGDAVTVPVGGALEIDDSRVLGDAVYAGLGIGIRPAREVQRAARRGQLRRVLPGHRFEGVDVYAVVSKGQSRLPRVAACLSILEAAVRALG